MTMDKKKIDIRNLTAEQKRKLHRWLRGIIQLISFLFLSSGFTAAFGGVKYIAGQLGNGEKIQMTAFVAALCGLCAFTIIFGRFFCGFACAFGSLGDAVHGVYRGVCKKCRKKTIRLNKELCAGLSLLKYIVLAGIVVLCFLGTYSELRGFSPWDVFSMIHGMNLRLTGYIPGLILLALILVGMCVQERFFCRFLCPMGAVFSMLPALPAFSLGRKREQCAPRCSACRIQCPSDIELPENGSCDTAGECFQCQKCVDRCPKSQIHCNIGEGLKGSEVWFTLLRAAALFVLCRLLGIA